MHRSVDVDVVRDVVLDEAEVAVREMRDVGRVACQEVVDPDHFVAAIEERLGEVGTDEPGGPCDHDALFHEGEAGLKACTTSGV